MFYLYTAFFLSIMNLTSIKIMLPEIMLDLGLELNWLTWVVNAYTLPLAALITIAGRVGDIYGPRKFFVGGIVTLGLGSLLCGLAFSPTLLIAGRVVQAVGAALLVPNSMAILLAHTEADRRGRALGIWGSIGASGAVIGPVLSGFLSDFMSWRGAFMIIAVLALLMGAASWKKFMFGSTVNKAGGTKEAAAGRAKKADFDIPGALALIGAVTALLLGLTMLPDRGWENGWVSLSLGACVVLIIAFILAEKRAASPLISPALAVKPGFSLGLLVGFLEQFAVAGTMFIMPIYFSRVLGYGAAGTALLLTPAAITVTFFSPVGGRLADRLGPGLPITAGMIVRAGSYLMLALITPQTTYPFIAAALALNGLGFALTSTPALHSVLSAVDSGEHGITTGAHNMIRFTGAAAGTTVSGIVLYALIPATFEGLTGPVAGFRETYLLGAAACLPGVAAGAYLARMRWKNRRGKGFTGGKQPGESEGGS